LGIFSDYAPLYWAAGLPVIPLRTKNKMPDITAWSAYGSEMPSEGVRAHWLASYPNGNIGLPFGPASGLCAIDIDLDPVNDPSCIPMVEAILAILPETPWVRIGKKGMGLIYKWSGQKNFKLRGEDGGMVLEFLGLGNQMVMPPSIHPDTQKPYTSDNNLWEVLDRVQELDEDIEDKLRALLGKAGFSLGAGGRSSPLDVIPAGERDVQMVRHAGYLARVVLGIDKSSSFGLWAAIQQMYTWVSDFTAKVSGDEMDPNKGVAKLLEFLIKDLEKGKTLPEGWDADMPEEWAAHPTVKMLAEKNASARWTVTRARDWLSGKVAENMTDDDWVGARVEELLGLVAADENFTEFQMRQLVPHIMRTAKGLDLKKTDLMQGWKAAKKGIDGEEWEDHETIAGIVLEEMQRNGEVRYDAGQFWQWSGSCFQPLDDPDVYSYVTTTVKGSPLLRRHSDYTSVVNVLRVKCRGALMEVEENGLNFANGFVDEGLRILDHDPKYGATFTLPFNYVPDAGSRCPLFMAFLHSIWGHKEDFDKRVMLLQEMMAVTMFKIATKYQKAFLLYGRAGTGKTQILEIIQALMPPSAVASLGPQHWAEQFSPTDLVGKAVNICGELPESQVIAGNTFKEIIEGSNIRTSFKNKDGFTFRPICAHWFASNFLPMSRDSSRGFIRRWIVLDFDRVIPEEKQIKGLAQMIVSEEREAIAAWVLEGLRRILDTGVFTKCPSSEARIEQMRRINNSVFAFIETGNGIARGDGAMKCRDVYDMYSFHMKDVGRGMPVSFERFNQMLDDLDLVTEMRDDLMGTHEWWVIGLVKKERAS
jgi:putative DNA primase/helicase